MIKETKYFIAPKFEENSADAETFKSPELSCWLSSCTHMEKNMYQVNKP